MNITIIRSKRKTVALQIRDIDDIIVRAPNRMPRADIQKFVDSHMDWIQKNLEKMKKAKEATDDIEPLSEKEVRELADRACKVISERVKHFAPIVGVTYGRITIKNQKTRWGSCSTKGNLNFNVALMLVPPEVLDYVVVHELCHRLEMNHSPRFWNEVGKVIPDYKKHEKWLKENGKAIIPKILLKK